MSALRVREQRHAADRPIALVSLPPWGLRVPPLGVVCLAEVLRRRDWPVRVFDGNLELHEFVGDAVGDELWALSDALRWLAPRYEREIAPWIRPRLQRLIDEILAARPLLVGVSLGSMFCRSVAEELVREVRRLAPDTLIIGGGNGVFTEADRAWFRQDGFDCFVQGEGEATLVEIVERVRAGQTWPGLLAGIAGVIPWRAAGGDPGASFAPRAQLADLASLPFPTYEGLEVDRYAHVSLIMSRGCPRTCQFCDNHARLGAYRRLPAEVVFEAMAYHVRRGRRRFEFNDVVMNGDAANFELLVEKILQAGWDIEWTGAVTARKEMNAGLLARLRRSGVRRLKYGIESFSDDVLRLMKKGTSASVAEEVLHRTREAGIGVHMFLIAGFPGETEERFRETLAVLERTRGVLADSIGVMGCLLPDRAPISEHADRFGVQKTGPLPLVTWQGADQNTYEERLDRVYRVASLLASQGFRPSGSEARDEVDCVLVSLPRDTAKTALTERGTQPWARSARECRELGLLPRVVDLEAAVEDCAREVARRGADDLGPIEQVRLGLGALLEEFDRVPPYLPPRLQRCLDEILCSRAPYVVLWVPAWPDDGTLRLASALRTHRGQCLLAAGPGVAASREVPVPFDGLLLGRVPHALHTLLRAYRAGASPPTESPDLYRLASDGAGPLPWWVPVVEQVDSSLEPGVASESGTPSGDERIALDLVFRRASPPLRFRVRIGSRMLDAVAGGPVSADILMPAGRVPAGTTLTLEARLPPWFRHQPRRWLELQAFESRADGREVEVLRALPGIPVALGEEPSEGRPAFDLAAVAAAARSGDCAVSPARGPTLRWTRRQDQTAGPSLRSGAMVRWPLREFSLVRPSDQSEARDRSTHEAGMAPSNASPQRDPSKRGSRPRQPLAVHAPLLREVLTRMGAAPGSPLPGWTLRQFQVLEASEAVIRAVVERGDECMRLELLPGDSPCLALAEASFVKLRHESGHGPPDEATSLGLRALCSLLDHYMKKACAAR